MDAEKRSSKGGFFQLFDWNGKSRKKLFSSKSELPECSKQGKENSSNSAASQFQQMKMHEPGRSTVNDYNSVSSVSSEEGYGSKVPGVVARLMGLESLPKTDLPEAPNNSTFINSYSFKDSHPPRTRTDIQSEHHIIDYGNTRNKLDGLSSNPIDFRVQKVQNRSIDRFQTEILPPKSSRSIYSTHHRLLSPIKSPGFIFTKNTACIMEEAAKMIEQSPQVTTKGKSSFGSPSVPLRIRDLKEKLEAAQRAPRDSVQSQRAKDNHTGNYMKGQSNDRGQRGLEGAQLLRHAIGPKQDRSRSLKNEKAHSSSSQIKANVQLKEGSSRSGNRSLNQKGDNRVKPVHFDKKQVNMQKSVQRRTDVLKQNNHKQNCASSKEKSQIVSCEQDGRVSSTKSSFRVNKAVNKTADNTISGTRKKNLAATDTGKEASSSNTKNFPGKRRPVNGNDRTSGNAVNDVLVNKSDRSVKCNVSVDGFTNWDTIDSKSGVDVVSFTFTSPIKKSISGSQASGQLVEKDNSLSVVPADNDPTNVSYLSSLGFNVIGSDALSVLLEQKLKELACMVEPSDSNLVRQGQSSGPASSLHDTAPSPSTTNSTCAEHEKQHHGLLNHNQRNHHDFDHSSVDEIMFDTNSKWQESEDYEESSNSRFDKNETEHREETDCPILSQPSYSGESCNSLDSKISYTSNGTGNKQCSSLESYETVSFISSRHPHYLEDELELSDSASSLSVGGMERKDRPCTSSYKKFEPSPNWKLIYVKEVLGNTHFQLEDYVLGQARLIVTSSISAYGENQKAGSDKAVDEYYKLEQKLIFDFMSECLEFRCEQISAGSYNAWIKLSTLFYKKEHLAEQLCREMNNCTNMKELMGDELVDKDMSSHYGKWVDFETEACEEVLDLSDEILSSLVDELATDLLS